MEWPHTHVEKQEGYLSGRGPPLRIEESLPYTGLHSLRFQCQEKEPI